MAIRKKKKKKEEFDASLMGGYLPGARAPVSVVPTLPSRQVPQATRNLLGPYPILKESAFDVLAYEWNDFQRAWWEYALGAGTVQMIAQPPQAWMLTKAGVYPTFRIGLMFEFGVGTMALATIATLVDPYHHWEGRGLDETAFYKRRVTNAARKPEWGINDPWYDKAVERHGWGASL